MEPFRFTGQSITVLALMAAVAIIVAVAAPFGSIALAAAALLALGAVLIKAMLRARDWWPLTAVEGTVALSAAVLLAGGLAVIAYGVVTFGSGEPLRMAIGWPHVDPARTGDSGGPRPGTRNAYIPDAALHAEFVAWLTGKGIKHEVMPMRGEDWVVWDESAGDLVRQFMEARAGADCKGKVAAGKSGPGRC